jgi:hypothetical protein
MSEKIWSEDTYRKGTKIAICIIVLGFSAALSTALNSLLPNTFVAAFACTAPTTISLMLCLHVMHLDSLARIQERTLDLIGDVVKGMDRVAEDNEKITKKVNELVDRYKALYDMIKEEEAEETD